MIRAFISRILDNPWPDAKPLPPHVIAVRLDPKLLYLHMMEAQKPTDRTGGYKS